MIVKEGCHFCLKTEPSPITTTVYTLTQEHMTDVFIVENDIIMLLTLLRSFYCLFPATSNLCHFVPLCVSL